VSAPHWDEVYRSRGADEVSWFQPSPVVALELIAASGVSLEVPVIDVGAGASTLVDGQLARGHRHITLLDVAASAFAPTRTRLGPSAPGVRFIVADVTTWKPSAPTVCGTTARCFISCASAPNAMPTARRSRRR
jgi:hypothetical protein